MVDGFVKNKNITILITIGLCIFPSILMLTGLENLLYFIFKSYHLSEFNFIFRVYKIMSESINNWWSGLYRKHSIQSFVRQWSSSFISLTIYQLD